MSEYTPSQAEGEPEPDGAEGQPPRTTPSQAEGEDTASPDADESAGQGDE
ncbi:hypothetical protein ACIHEJ_04935 [Streptomyces sp. NPDC052301]